MQSTKIESMAEANGVEAWGHKRGLGLGFFLLVEDKERGFRKQRGVEGFLTERDEEAEDGEKKDETSDDAAAIEASCSKLELF